MRRSSTRLSAALICIGILVLSRPSGSGQPPVGEPLVCEEYAPELSSDERVVYLVVAPDLTPSKLLYAESEASFAQGARPSAQRAQFLASRCFGLVIPRSARRIIALPFGTAIARTMQGINTAGSRCSREHPCEANVRRAAPRHQAVAIVSHGSSVVRSPPSGSRVIPRGVELDRLMRDHGGAGVRVGYDAVLLGPEFESVARPDDWSATACARELVSSGASAAVARTLCRAVPEGEVIVAPPVLDAPPARELLAGGVDVAVCRAREDTYLVRNTVFDEAVMAVLCGEEGCVAHTIYAEVGDATYWYTELARGPVDRPPSTTTFVECPATLEPRPVDTGPVPAPPE